MMQRVLISGANSGIGRATAAHLAARGYQVFAGMRNTQKAEKLLRLVAEAKATVEPIELDVDREDSVRGAVKSIEAAGGPLDILINNAGVAHNATVEDVDIAVGKGVFDTNFWGSLRCIQATLPGMRDQGSGHVVNVSSVTGRIAALGQVVYAASKWAIECLSENLAQEVAPFGIGVSIIEPGVTRTAILAKNLGHPEPTVYGDAYRRMLQFYAKGVAAEVSPDAVAQTIYRALTDPDPKLRYCCGWGGSELIEGRSRLSDEGWVKLGLCDSDEDYFVAFEEAFGLDLRTSSD